jgi:hypothetical protein
VLIVEEHVPGGGLASLLLGQVPDLRCRALSHLTPSAAHNTFQAGSGGLRLSSAEVRRSVEALIHHDLARP